MENPYESPSTTTLRKKQPRRDNPQRLWKYLLTLNYVWAVLFLLIAGISQVAPLHLKVLTIGPSLILVGGTIAVWRRLEESWLLKAARGITVLPAMFLILLVCWLYGTSGYDFHPEPFNNYQDQIDTNEGSQNGL